MEIPSNFKVFIIQKYLSQGLNSIKQTKQIYDQQQQIQRLEQIKIAHIKREHNYWQLLRKSFTSSLRQCEQLVKLEFEPYCADNSAFVQEIGGWLGKLKDLIELSLIFNQSTNLKQESWKYVFQGLEQLKQLQKLEIIIGESCSLEEQGLNLLSYAISSLTCLKKLIIIINKSNYVSVLSLKNLVDNFKYFSQIEELKLQVQEYQIDISEEKLNLWQGLSFLQSIQDLDISLNLQYLLRIQFSKNAHTLFIQTYLAKRTQFSFKLKGERKGRYFFN
ncbi:hypothetical protein TTHERM_001302823 (macronuclear) [Tetrahymena thermophila SB210]|uniref:Kinase domain protein n=1 Tax=Tetrahymena thermophila (strain SB210) TaxID=312017 RepID=W7XFJ6_TETTS|nr:hypothetical protein TTHERM_001302823 [Tetrahymena thermophila SB210]EWS75608.1 hypothetical protein TTHERM_001302823 [Tetrahymena thermophila SB210]|eukprot:XP_012651861.1 hypothetical protein TTHERM_001302823 [Tetrahymena thermophila SB210]